jgi:hypothetical protein
MLKKRIERPRRTAITTTPSIEKDAVENNGEKIEEIYYVPSANYTFECTLLDEKGQKINKTNPSNGLPIYLGSVPEYLTKPHKFTVQNGTVENACSVYVVLTSTPEYIKARLKELAESGSSEVMTEEQWEKTRHPERFEERKRRLGVEQELSVTQKAHAKAEKTLKQISEQILNVDATSLDKLKEELKKLGG